MAIIAVIFGEIGLKTDKKRLAILSLILAFVPFILLLIVIIMELIAAIPSSK